MITQSDVSAAVRLGLEHPPASAQDPFAAVLDKLIERRLTLVEVHGVGVDEDPAAGPPPQEADPPQPGDVRLGVGGDDEGGPEQAREGDRLVAEFPCVERRKRALMAAQRKRVRVFARHAATRRSPRPSPKLS
mgnify:CR=1 FL=1